VQSLEDLREGMVLPGVITNITDFGAFVDVGVHQDGLVHISQMADRRIQHPGEVCAIGQTVQVRVLGVEPERRRISLSMKGVAQAG
jgi:protein Tex